MCVRIEAIGLNRAEAMFRSDAYLEAPRLPARLGYEASATVEAMGEGVHSFASGDAVSVTPAFSINDYGVYADTAIVPAYGVVQCRPRGDPDRDSIGPIPIATTRTRARAAALDAVGAAHGVVTSEQDLLTEVSHATAGKGARPCSTRSVPPRSRRSRRR